MPCRAATRRFGTYQHQKPCLRFREVIVAPNQNPGDAHLPRYPTTDHTKLTTPGKRIMDIPSAAPSLFRIMSRDLLQHLDSGSTGPVGLDFKSCLRSEECKLDIKANTILNSKNHWLFALVRPNVSLLFCIARLGVQ
jgi:hypothetical protein